MLAFVSDTGILVVVLAVILLFGTSQIPKLARNIGEAGKELRKAQAETSAPDVSAPVAGGAVGAAAPAPSLPPTAGDRAASGAHRAEESITLSRAQFEALLKVREDEPSARS